MGMIEGKIPLMWQNDKGRDCKYPHTSLPQEEHVSLRFLKLVMCSPELFISEPYALSPAPFLVCLGLRGFISHPNPGDRKLTFITNSSFSLNPHTKLQVLSISLPNLSPFPALFLLLQLRFDICLVSRPWHSSLNGFPHLNFFPFQISSHPSTWLPAP